MVLQIGCRLKCMRVERGSWFADEEEIRDIRLGVSDIMCAGFHRRLVRMGTPIKSANGTRTGMPPGHACAVTRREQLP